MHLASGRSRMLNRHFGAIYILSILMTVRARLQLASFLGLFEPGNEARLQLASFLGLFEPGNKARLQLVSSEGYKEGNIF